MVDIGFKNSSNSDRNEGPTPPPDWSTIVNEGPPPPSFDVPVKYPACYEATFTFLAIKVSKDGSWSVDYPQNVPIRGNRGTWGAITDFFGGDLQPGVTRLPSGMGYGGNKPGSVAEFLKSKNSMFHAIQEMQKEVLGKRLKGAENLDLTKWACHIIKMCICCETWAEWQLYQAYLASPFCPAIVSTAHGGGWHKVLSDTDGDWWIYLNFTLEHVCDGCENPDIEECRCEGTDQIDLTDKIKAGTTKWVGGDRRAQYIEIFDTKYTDSGGNEHTIPDTSGAESFKKVLKKILEIEDELFDCTKSGLAGR